MAYCRIVQEYTAEGKRGISHWHAFLTSDNPKGKMDPSYEHLHTFMHQPDGAPEFESVTSFYTSELAEIAKHGDYARITGYEKSNGFDRALVRCVVDKVLRDEEARPKGLRTRRYQRKGNPGWYTPPKRNPIPDYLLKPREGACMISRTADTVELLYRECFHFDHAFWYRPMTTGDEACIAGLAVIANMGLKAAKAVKPKDRPQWFLRQGQKLLGLTKEAAMLLFVQNDMCNRHHAVDALEFLLHHRQRIRDPQKTFGAPTVRNAVWAAGCEITPR